MLYRILSYLKFLIKSTNQHGVHSPFVYNLVTKCFYDKSFYKSYKSITFYRKKLLKNKQNNTISNIERKTSSTKKRTKILYRFVNYFQFKNILELGTSMGTATHAMLLGNPETKITTIECRPNISAFTKGIFEQFNLKNIEVLTGDFCKAIQPLSSNKYDLIYFESNHQKQNTLDYFETLLPTATNNSVFIFDNIYWSKDMTEAWNSIKNHPKVTVTIDTFFLGFIFFRKEQAKEHFTIRL